MDEILRSEAHYAALLFADLRAATNVRERLMMAIEQAAGRPIGGYEAAYVEPAPFRDAWKLFKEDERRALVRQLVLWADSEVDPKQVEDMVDAHGKVRSPASWTTGKIVAISSKLLRVAWMFRARPDILVVTEKASVWLELKVYSRNPSERPDGFSQHQTQSDIATMVGTVVPSLRARFPVNLVIQRRKGLVGGREALTWRQIVSPDWVNPRLIGI